MNRKLNRILVEFVCLAIFGLMISCQSQNINPPTETAIPVQKFTSTPEPSPSPLPTQPPLPSAASTLTSTPGVDEILTSVVNALWVRNTKAHRMNCTSVFEDGNTQKYMNEFVPPDRKYVIYYDQDVEYIVVGDKVYINEGGSEWEATQLPAANFMRNIEETTQEISESLHDVQRVREDMLGGKGIVVYKFNSVSTYNNIELSSQTELWVGEADGLPYKMLIDGEIAASRNNPDTGESEAYAARSLTTCLLEFDSTISIEPPVQ